MAATAGEEDPRYNRDSLVGLRPGELSLRGEAIAALGLDLLDDPEFQYIFTQSFTTLVMADQYRRRVSQLGIPEPSRLQDEGPISLLALAIKRLFEFGDITARIKFDDVQGIIYPDAHARMLSMLGVLGPSTPDEYLDISRVETVFSTRDRDKRKITYRRLVGDFGGHHIAHQVVPIRHPFPEKERGGVKYLGRYERFMAFDMWGRQVGLPLVVYVPHWQAGDPTVHVMPEGFDFNTIYAHAKESNTTIGIPRCRLADYHTDTVKWRDRWRRSRAARLS